MSKTFTCCELVKWIKDFLAQSQWGKDEERYQALEFINKASQKTTNRRIKEWVSPEGYSEPVWTYDNEYLFCEECRKWFEQKEDLQHGLIMTEIEKEKAEGTFYSRPEVQKILEENKQKFDKWGKELGLGNSKTKFWQKPAGIILIAGILGILGFLLGYYFTRRRKQRSKN